MIAANQPPPPDEPSGNVGQGLSPGEEREARAHARLYHRAIKAGWNITRRGRKRVIDEMMTAVEQGELDTKIAAARTIIAADSVNVQREKMILTRPPETTVNVAIGVGVSVEEAQSSPEYLEFLRAQRLEKRGNAGLVRGDDNGRSMGTSPPPDDTGPGDNGHPNGNGRH